MSDITVLSPEKLAEIRQRYSPKPIPKCRICGAEISIGAVSASRTVYACSGATHDENGWHYAPGRSLADDHYSESRVTVVDVSDPDVLALVEALEKAQHDGAVNWEAAASMNVENQELKQRIAELEVSRNKLREGMAAIYNAICADGASTSLSAILTFVKRAHEESAPAGIQVIEGERQ